MKNLADIYKKTQNFPFNVEVSFDPLLKYCMEEMPLSPMYRDQVLSILQNIERTAPLLFKPLQDLSIVEKYADQLEMLLSMVFPRASWEQELSLVIAPFSLFPVYASPKVRNTLNTNMIPYAFGLEDEEHLKMKVGNAYSIIINKYYRHEEFKPFAIRLKFKDPETGFFSYLQAQVDPRFMRVHAHGTVPDLDEKQKKMILGNAMDIAEMMSLLPPSLFSFEGVALSRAIDTTHWEVLSELKQDLISRGTILSQDGFSNFQKHLGALFQRSDISSVLCAFRGEEVYIVKESQSLCEQCIYNDSQHYKKTDFSGSVFEKAVETGKSLIVGDLAQHQPMTAVENQILAEGYRNLVVLPLVDKGEIIGIMYVASPRPYDLGREFDSVFKNLIPLISMAIRRSLGELDQRVQAILREKCTAIHPTVEWRFEKEALKFMSNERKGISNNELGPIIFPDLYPLYGASDIRGSSSLRNQAIQADLIEQLTLALEVVENANRRVELPISFEMAFQIKKRLKDLDDGLESSSEISIQRFIRNELKVYLDSLKTHNREFDDLIRKYYRSLGDGNDTLRHHRQQFDQSVSVLNNMISSYLDEEQIKAQAIFPHYFVKHGTDGVEHTIYIGQSLVNESTFNPMYLRNLRLWEFITTCGVARKAIQLREGLPLELDVAHLILVQSIPIAIRFRLDEKRFDVDGAYDIRYEIIKRRIDKALVSGTKERATQTGHITIIYSHELEETEYLEYIEYLQDRDELETDIAHLELEELQGVSGLKALRVRVKI